MKKITSPLRLAALGAAFSFFASSTQAASILNVDFSRGAGLAPQAGWESISGIGSPSGTFSGYTGLSAGNITVTVSGVEFDRLYRNGFTANPADDLPGTDLDEMYGDLLFRNESPTSDPSTWGTVDVTISGLLAGTYVFTTYHLINTPNPGDFDISVQDANGLRTIGNFEQGTGRVAPLPASFDPTIITFLAESNGTDNIVIQMDATTLSSGGNTGGWFGYNGLTVAPEPSSTALLGLGILGMLFHRRR